MAAWSEKLMVSNAFCQLISMCTSREVPVFNASGDVLLYERLTQRLAGWSRGEAVRLEEADASLSVDAFDSVLGQRIVLRRCAS